MQRNAMLLAIAAVYYIRLPNADRKLFEEAMGRKDEQLYPQAQGATMTELLREAMEDMVGQAEIPKGIAKNDPLLENMFATMLAVLNKIPLLIVGPPGSSKTLSVNLVKDNMKGRTSKRSFYQELPALEFFHYQCSRRSNSIEISKVAQRASKRQQHYAKKGSTNQVVVFMDEAGLPEDAKESLKVLHDLWEVEMSATNDRIAFLAISNHVLDAAKSNRALNLFRSEASLEDLMQIAFDSFSDQVGGEARARDDIIEGLCRTYVRLLEVRQFADDDTNVRSTSRVWSSERGWFFPSKEEGKLERDFFKFSSHFGLRDFMHLMRLLGRRVSQGDPLAFQSVLRALERNFNGVNQKEFLAVANEFLGDSLPMQPPTESNLRNPVEVLIESLSDRQISAAGNLNESAVRYKLIIDETDDDSLMRLLKRRGILRADSTILKCSDFPDNAELQDTSIIAGVKFAAMQGHSVVLSGTERINESFFDLFNQHFQVIPSEKGNKYYANIALADRSRPCRVEPTFQCLMHMSAREMRLAPVPFKNRFEKYRVTLDDMLQLAYEQLASQKLAAVVQLAVEKVQSFVEHVGFGATLCGIRDADQARQTVKSLFLDLLPAKQSHTREKVVTGAADELDIDTVRPMIDEEEVDGTHTNSAATPHDS